MKKILQSISEFIKGLAFRISPDEKIAFARHLAIMTKAGLPLLKSLRMLYEQARTKTMKKILDSITKDVSEGQFLSVGLAKFRAVFGEVFINIINVGEKAGILAPNLEFLATELKKKQELRSKVIGALLYPIIIIIATFGITGLLTIFIFPKILPIFSSLNVDLPFTTQILITLSNIITEHGGVAALGILIFLASLWLVLRIKKVNYAWNFILLKIPVLGKMIQAVNMANFSRTLGSTLKSDIKIVEAITITSNSVSNPIYKKELTTIAELVRKGEVISEYLINKKVFFPAILSQMVNVGETTGNLSDTLLYLSDFYESEVENTTKNLSNILEPILMVAMGATVGFVAIAIITPIYQVSQTLGR